MQMGAFLGSKKINGMGGGLLEGLFKDADGMIYGPRDLYRQLKMIGADDCEILFIHSDVMFGTPVQGFQKKKYLAVLYEVLQDLRVRDIIVPTFTYSFCNHENYDVKKSRTSMGAFNEFVRKRDNRYRTNDPILSLSVPDRLREFFMGFDGNHSLGANSGLDALHHLDGVKFLFLGANMGSCFTYVHYVEKIFNVPYRFDMQFHGMVTDENGCVSNRIQYIHTQCKGVRMPADYGYFEDDLVDRGLAKKVRMGDKYLTCLSEKDAYEQIVGKISGNINYFLAQPFAEADLVHTYTYDWKKGRITHC